MLVMAIMCTVITIIVSFITFIFGVMLGMYICIDAAKKQTNIKWGGKDIYFTIKEYDPDED